jgi:uncharacterized lipoprotein YmbA
MNKPLAMLFAAFLPLAGCGGSPPTHFFTLQPVVPQSRTPQAGGGPVQVVAVHIPAALDRQQMVRHPPSGELQVSNQNRWGAPLDEIIQRVLTQDLAARLPRGDVVFPQQPVPPKTRQIVLDILQFAGDGAGHVVLNGSWSLLESGASAPKLTRQLRLEEPTGPAGYGADAQAMGQALAKLADDIAANLTPKPP